MLRAPSKWRSTLQLLCWPPLASLANIVTSTSLWVDYTSIILSAVSIGKQLKQDSLCDIRNSAHAFWGEQ